ncbi:YitT family protein [Clostridium sp. MSJ-4]|uniref:YitT family protein n=1 Tax=Clostridium simiarum TaxID=2841506 RepID=A0ABS6F1I3_9CLOT|nr:YitT family protein [Clostridium simiarum]MBU5592377.1 YitT family protein [Clostridium simiarum]
MNKVTKNIKDYVIITFGITLVAIGTYFFLMPNDIAAGGVNGLAMIINKHFPVLPVGTSMFFMNIILFIIAFIMIGKTFGARTIYASFLLSGVIRVLEVVYPHNVPFTDDALLELFFGILIQGAGMGIIFNKNASTGGTDIIAKILNKYFHTNLGKGVLMSDLTITVLAVFTFGLKEGLYALMAVTLNGMVIDRMIEGLNSCMEVRIISEKRDLIEEFILKKLGRGATTYYAKGSYSKHNIEVLCTIVDTKEFIKIRNFIKDVDPKAFVNVTEVFETLGDGFKTF